MVLSQELAVLLGSHDEIRARQAVCDAVAAHNLANPETPAEPSVFGVPPMQADDMISTVAQEIGDALRELIKFRGSLDRVCDDITGLSHERAEGYYAGSLGPGQGYDELRRRVSQIADGQNLEGEQLLELLLFSYSREVLALPAEHRPSLVLGDEAVGEWQDVYPDFMAAWDLYVQALEYFDIHYGDGIEDWTRPGRNGGTLEERGFWLRCGIWLAEAAERIDHRLTQPLAGERVASIIPASVLSEQLDRMTQDPLKEPEQTEPSGQALSFA